MSDLEKKVQEIVAKDTFGTTCRQCAFFPGGNSGLCLAPWTDGQMEDELENNPIVGFLAEYENPLNMSTTKVYEDFKDWCHENGHKGIATKARFSREVCKKYKLTTKSRRDSSNSEKFERYYVRQEDVLQRDTL